MEHEIKYAAFWREDGKTNEMAIKQVMKVTGWKDFNVEILPDEIIDTGEFHCDFRPRYRTKGSLRITRVV